MLNYKKAIHIVVIIWFSIAVSLFLVKIFYYFIWVEINNTFLYNNNINKSSDKIFILEIDNKTLKKLQQNDIKVLNFQKKVFADVIEKLESYNAKAIWFDIVFANISEDYKILQEAFSKYNNIVIAAKTSSSENQDSEMILPIDAYSNATWWLIDQFFLKNVVNRLNPSKIINWKQVESLSIALYRKYIWDNSWLWKTSNWYYIINPIKKIPLTEDNKALINFFNSPWEYPSASLIDFIEWRVKKDKIDGKIILVWEKWSLIHDAFFSPIDLSVQMPWVEFHANMIDTILNSKFLHNQSKKSQHLWIGIIVIILSSLYFFLTLRQSIIIFVSYFILIMLVWRYLFWDVWLVIDVFIYSVFGLVIFIIAYWYKFLIVDKNRRHIEHAFSHYLSKDIVNMIASNENALKLWWEKRNVTIFFSDIVWFTTISEMLWTEKIFNLLWEYLSEMTDILLNNKWTLDKYIWDAVMGFFNAPVFIDKPEYYACKTALEQQRRLTYLNWKWKHIWYPPLHIRIWIDSWEAMVWNIWSRERFNYTVIWDHVNLASRLEWVNKEYLTKICISEETYLKVKDDFILRELDTIKVKWKVKWIKIYELLWFKWDDINVDRLRKYENALYLYYDEKYIEAKNEFEVNIWDLPSSIMVKRCEDILDGKTKVVNSIYEMKTK